MNTNKAIYIIRHGETDYNKRGIIQGSGVDSDLNETGILQSEMFFRAYHHIPFKKIYTSTLKRTIQSVRPFIEKGIAWEPLEELNEINWGMFEGRVSSPETIQKYDLIIREWQQGLLDREIEGGESPRQVNKRQQRGLETIMSRPDEDPILIAMHGRALKCFLCLLNGTPLHQMEDYKHTNLCLYVIEYTPDSGFKMVVRNSTDHLF